MSTTPQYTPPGSPAPVKTQHAPRDTRPHPAAVHPFGDAAKEIRLLRWQDPERDTIECTLHNFLHAEAPPYETASYQWGDPAPVCEIHLDGLPYACGRNCWKALFRARRHRGCDYVWLDAICINQKDLVEKNAQVGQMARVYTNCRRVLISLSEDRDSDESLFEMLGARKLCYMDWILFIGEAAANSMWDAARGIAKDSYWTRLWIIQEIYCAPARLLICGSTAIDLEALVKFEKEALYPAEFPPHTDAWAVRQMREFAVETEVGFTSDQAMWQILHQTAEKRQDEHGDGAMKRLLTYATRYSSWNCAIPRDRIYGFLAMADPKTEMLFTPDYQCSDLEVAIRVLTAQPENVDDLESAINLCKILSLNTSSDVREAFRLRGQGRRSSTYRGTRPLSITASDEAIWSSYWNEWLVRYCCFGIWTNADGQFVTAIHPRQDAPKKAFVPPQVCQTANARPLFAASRVIGMISKAASSGDRILIPREYNFGWPELGLVIRKAGLRQLRIIGYAIILAVHTTCPGAGACRCGEPAIPHTDAYWHHRVSIAFEAEDLLLYACRLSWIERLRWRQAYQYDNVISTPATCQSVSHVEFLTEPNETKPTSETVQGARGAEQAAPGT